MDPVIALGYVLLVVGGVLILLVLVGFVWVGWYAMADEKRPRDPVPYEPQRLDVQNDEDRIQRRLEDLRKGRLG